MRQSKGFTLIELLIVIAVLGILIIAILSALDPLEQMRKARDAGRKSDAGQLLAAYERYYATFQCYPWDLNAPNCSNVTAVSRGTAVNITTALLTTGVDSGLITQGELKAVFRNRSTVVNSQLWVSENSTRSVSVCVEPESRSARQGGMGTLYDNRTQSAASVILSCSGTYPTTNCYICLPQ